MAKERKFDLEDRLIEFASRCIKASESLPASRAGIHLSDQLVRSGTSPALNYGEAQGAESAKDFVHKMKICLKELRETMVCLKIIVKAELIKTEKAELLIKEVDELVAIFVTSVKTAKERNKGIS